MKLSAIILAAGKGERYGKQKQFSELDGVPVWYWAYKACKDLDETIVVGIYCEGGKTRQESVRNGIEKAKGDYVVILDAARPLVTKEQIKNIVKEVRKHPSVSFGVKPTDTIYDNGEYKREDLVALQVPQAFDRKLLLEAHQKTKAENATDDTSLMLEVHGIKPKIIEGGQNLYKLTYPEDIKILKALCQEF